MRAKGYERYSFNDIDFSKPFVARDALRAKGSTTTGANGAATFGIPATLATSEGPQTFTLSASVTDQNGQVVAGSTSVTVHPASLYVGIHPSQYVASEGANARIDLVTVDTDGIVLPNRPVTVRVYDRQWITTKQVIPGGGRMYKSEPKDTHMATLQTTTNAKGEGSVTYKPAKSGQLRVIAEAIDAKGRSARAASFLWVWGTFRASAQITNDDAIKLVADKESYEVGDTADVLVPAPYPGATALITVERGKIKTTEVRKFATNSERLRIPITDRSVPDVFVSVVMYWPPTTGDPIPRYKVGYVELPVSTATRVLNVKITPDRDQAKPGDTVVGEGTNELLSTQPLLLRPALPRELRVGDTAEIRALVRNATKTDAAVKVTLKAEGITVSGDLTRSITIHPSDSVLVSWPAKIESEGTARITFTATGPGDLNDAVVQEVPVIADLTPETTATGGIVTRDGQLDAVYLPQFADPKHGTLGISVQSALTGTMSDELMYLRSYAQEGAGMVASRLIATLAVRRAEMSAKVDKGRDRQIASDLAGLIGRQRPDGGWAWCDEAYCQTDLNVTGWVLIALGEAQRDGLAVDPNIVRNSTSIIFGEVNRPTDIAYPPDINQRAFLLYALASAGARAAVSVTARALFEQYRIQLGNWGRAYLLLALIESGAKSDDAAVRTLFDELASATIPSANGNHWEDSDQKRGKFFANTATTALVSLAIARIKPDHALVAQTIRWLVVARTTAYGWGSTVDRAMAILALSSYAVGTGELGGDYEYKVQLDDKDVLGGLVKPNTTPMTASKKLPLATFTPGTTSLLSFTRDYGKPGRLYYTLDLRYMTPAQGIESLNRGFAISHTYTLLDDPLKPVTQAKLGETVRVTVTIMVKTDHTYVVVEDPLPAGLEAVDARLRNVDPALRAQLDSDRLKSAQKQSGGGYFAPWYWWYYTPWSPVA